MAWQWVTTCQSTGIVCLSVITRLLHRPSQKVFSICTAAIYVGQTLLLTGQIEKVFSALKTRTTYTAFESTGSTVPFCRVKRRSASVTCRQVGFSSGKMCHPQSHLAHLPFVSSAFSQSQSLTTQPSALPTGPHYGQQLTKGRCWEITSKQASPSQIMCLKMAHLSVLFFIHKERGLLLLLLQVMVTALKNQVTTRGSSQTHQTSQQFLLLGVIVQGSTAQYKDSGLVRWTGHLVPQEEIWLQMYFEQWMDGLCDIDHTICFSLSLFQGGIRTLGLHGSHHKCAVFENW